MPLPFSFAGRVDLPGLSDADVVVSRLTSALGVLKPRRMRRNGYRLDFSGGSYILRRVTRLNLLNIIGFGELAVEPAAGGVAVHYRIRFGRFFWMVTLSVPIAIGVGALVLLAQAADESAGAALWTVAPYIMVAAWLWLFGANVAYLWFRFPRWLRRSAATSDRSVWLTGA